LIEKKIAICEKVYLEIEKKDYSPEKESLTFEVL
jgi:hypothetical protein